MIRVIYNIITNQRVCVCVLAVSSISRVLRARFGKKDDEDDCDKKDEDGDKRAKHSIDGILGDKGRPQ